MNFSAGAGASGQSKTDGSGPIASVRVTTEDSRDASTWCTKVEFRQDEGVDLRESAWCHIRSRVAMGSRSGQSVVESTSTPSPAAVDREQTSQQGRSRDARCSVRRGDCQFEGEDELSKQSYPGVKVVSMRDDSQ